jgi:zinc/manganese transport system substrate-binding protein
LNERVARAWLALLALPALLVSGCASGLPSVRQPGVVSVVSTISAWGSILAQLGGAHVRETSIITNPATDPHDYEPTPADARALASARLVVENGVGYDAWAAKTLAASPEPGRAVINVGKLVGVTSGGNPHRWYSPADVEAVAAAITARLVAVDPADASYFRQQHQSFETEGLTRYHQLIDEIKRTYGGIAVGASESIFAPLSNALGLRLVTPARFLRAVSEGIDPSAADKAAIDQQIAHHLIKVYVYNSQNGTPDVAAQVRAARAARIPVVAISETLTPATASFQQWQVAQLEALRAALAAGAGR